MTYTTPLLLDLGTIEEMTADKGQGPTDGLMASMNDGNSSSPLCLTGDVFPGMTPGVLPE
jgi:hypothetical protein